ncbi:TetR/AcrR family tetracycline transcriptional repressor [Devosia sp. UYZn731]|uniref:TetR/AcrR family transcriptional regulator C-terminal domain-containing protein n=1 Tax=Devosia sp. UYZn731 TaxID=3156345 RepID=UPI003391FFDD
MAIERDKILDAALAVLAEVGLDQFTTRKLADRLGVQQPALYWHFKSKSALLDALNAEMLLRYHVHHLPTPGQTWDEFTMANARSFRKALLAVRDGARINAGTHPTTREFGDAERHLQLYVDAGFSPGEAFNIAIAVTRYVVGFVLEEQGERERGDEEFWQEEDPMKEIAPFPLLSTALKPLIAGGMINTEGVFEGGLGYLLAGMRESLAAQKTKTAP